jgi:hypothetical protein
MAMTFKHGAMRPPTTGGKEVPYACHLYENGETLPWRTLGLEGTSNLTVPEEKKSLRTKNNL